MKEFKDILKLPIRSDGYLVTDNDGHFICQMFSTDKYDFRPLITEALNEKAQREWGERKRWIKYTDVNGRGVFYRCGECMSPKKEISNYCPSCGVRLDPPKEG